MGNVDRLVALVVVGLLLLPCGACSQPWRFARAEYPLAGTQGSGRPFSAARDTADASGPVQLPGMPPPAATTGLPPWEQSPALAASYGSLSNIPPEGGTAAGGVYPPRGASFDAPAPVSPDASCAPPGLGDRLQWASREGWCRIRSDYRNYYDCLTMRDLWLGVGGGAVLANTSLDDDFQGWYQRDVRSSGTDDFAAFWKTFGEGQIFIPAYAGLALATSFFDDRPLIGGVNDFSDRVTRGYLVGAPPMLLMQALLGGSRPGESGVGSQWKPFDDSNGASGHAFVGAVPFITAARMCDRPLLKATLYSFSTFTAWSRVNDDAHYLSQAWLGWWMAYLACRAVDDTEHQDRYLTFTPLLTPEVAGVAIEYRR
jgi:hypothetical protein